MYRVTFLLLAAALAAAALAACGGDKRDTLSPATDPGAPVVAETPASAEEPPAAGAVPAPAEAPAAPAQAPQLVPTPAQPQPAQEPVSALNPEVVGVWRVYSARIFYDEGGGGTVDTTITRQLELAADGTWYFGSSAGSYSISDISADDWNRWGVEPYGPTRKITLFDWNGAVADGPMEESGGGVDFVWVIYPEGPPVTSAPGTVWMKFGHA